MARRCANPRYFFAPPKPDERMGKVLNWPCFSPGYHKNRLYTQDDTRKIVQNFAKLSGRLKAKLRMPAKLGHDPKQHLAQSLGLPAVGRITKARLAVETDLDDRGQPVPAGTLVIDIEDIPGWVCDRIQEGGYNDGSIELDHAYTDPDDPSRAMDGPVLTAIAFLGEEQPEVKGLPKPKVSFSSGFPAGRQQTTIVFSEVADVETRDQILAALQGMGIDTSDPALAGLADEALKALLAQLGGQKFSECMKAKYAAEIPTPTPVPPVVLPASDTSNDLKAMMSTMAAFSQRFGAIEAAVKDLQSVKSSAAMSTEFDAWHQSEKLRRATEVVTQAVTDGKIMPFAKEQTISDLCKVSNYRKDCFAKGHQSEGKTPFEAALAEITARQSTSLFSEKVNDTSSEEELSDFAREVLQMSPDGRKALAGRAKA